jgi:hypothetical protein
MIQLPFSRPEHRGGLGTLAIISLLAGINVSVIGGLVALGLLFG